jgi:hypothetical protein
VKTEVFGCRSLRVYVCIARACWTRVVVCCMQVKSVRLLNMCVCCMRVLRVCCGEIDVNEQRLGKTMVKVTHKLQLLFDKICNKDSNRMMLLNEKLMMLCVCKHLCICRFYQPPVITFYLFAWLHVELYASLSVLVNSASNIVTVVKIESRSFSTAEIQPFNTDNRQSDCKSKEYLWFICGLQVKTIIIWPLRKIVTRYLYYSYDWPGLRKLQSNW